MNESMSEDTPVTVEGYRQPWTADCPAMYRATPVVSFLMVSFWNCPTRWHHDSGGWRLAFCLPAHLGVRLGGGGGSSEGVWRACLRARVCVRAPTPIVNSPTRGGGVIKYSLSACHWQSLVGIVQPLFDVGLCVYVCVPGEEQY